MIEPAEAHDLPLAHQGGDGEAIAHGLAKGGEMRSDAVELLRSAHVPAEAGDHLVEYKKAAIALADRLDFPQEAGLGRCHGFGFEQDAGDAVRILLEESAQRFEIVVAELQCEI